VKRGKNRQNGFDESTLTLKNHSKRDRLKLKREKKRFFLNEKTRAINDRNNEKNFYIIC
jgi:hypothetical protein